MNETPDKQSIVDRLEFAKNIALEAGKSTLEHFQSADLDVESKSDDSPVTIADKNAELIIRNQLKAKFSEDAILGEEFGESPGTSGFRWILDPIDGTKSFITGVPLYGTMIGVEYGKRSVIGVVYIPGLDEGIYAATGQGAWHFQGDNDPIAAKVNDCPSLKEALFLTAQPRTYTNRGAIESFLKLEETAFITRTWSDCYGYLLVATGRAAAMVDPIMSIWDAAALQPILEEAGGTFTDWQGNPSIYSGEGIATNGKVLEEILAELKQHATETSV